LIEYNELLEDAKQDNVSVIENCDLSGTRIKGLYCNGVIALDKNIDTTREKKCILAEELGHHYTAVGNILDQSSVINRKQELYGRVYAYNKLVGLRGIVSAYKCGCQSFSDTADYLDVPEDFLQEVLECYKQKYGIYVKLDNYVIFFEPSIGVYETTEDYGNLCPGDLTE